MDNVVRTGWMGIVVLLLAGCGGSSRNPGSPVIDDGPRILVQGRVVNGQGKPHPEMPVAIPGHDFVVTNQDGRFEVDGVRPPYAVALFPAGNFTSAVVYVGLTRGDPTLESVAPGHGLSLEATASGTVSGGAGYPEPVNHETRVQQRLVDAANAGQTTAFGPANGVSGAFGPYAICWTGPSQTEVVYRALQTQKDAVTGLPVSYTGYGTRVAQVPAGQDLLNQDIALGPVATGTISGTLTGPPGYELTGLNVLLQHAPQDLDNIFGDPSPSPVFSYNVPDIPGTTLRVSAGIRSLDMTRHASVQAAGVSPGTTGIDIDMPVVPIGWWPPDGANGVDAGTLFHAEESPDCVYVFTFVGSSAPVLRVVTDLPFTSIPDLSAYGFLLPPATAYIWTVVTRGPFPDIDEAAGPMGLTPLGTWFNTNSPTRNFTTAP